MKKNEIENLIFGKIEAAESIVIFGHVNPDGDCVGSVMGMKKELQSLFPEKKVYGVGSRPSYLPGFFEKADEVSLETIQESLAVLVDLNCFERIEDQRALQAKDFVCFDHHIPLPQTTFPAIQDRDAPSATYVITKAFKKRYHFIDKEAAAYLFTGLVTDTDRFQLDGEPHTLSMASYLISLGVDYKAIYDELYAQDRNRLAYKAFLYEHVLFDGNVTYCIVHKEDYEPLGIPSSEAGEQADLLSRLDHHPIWVLFTEQPNGSIRVEFRANGKYDMQKVAKSFGGGGHFSASGCTIYSFDTIPEILNALKKL